eukprot:scaffold2456_cov129-Isochrysis_galbana.AAC.6
MPTTSSYFHRSQHSCGAPPCGENHTAIVFPPPPTTNRPLPITVPGTRQPKKQGQASYGRRVCARHAVCQRPGGVVHSIQAEINRALGGLPLRGQVPTPNPGTREGAGSGVALGGGTRARGKRGYRHSPDAHRVEDGLLGSCALLLGCLAAGEDLPESERLICGGRHNCRAVRRLRHVQNARGVPGQLGHLDHGRVLPENELVVRVAVRRDELFVVLGPLQRADLRVRIHRIEAGARAAVPEADHAIGRPAARCEKVALPRAPRKRLDGCLVLVEPEHWLIAHAIG